MELVFFKVTLLLFSVYFYKGNEKGLDSAFSILYLFINIGGFLAPLIINFVVGVHHPELYQYGFLVAAVAMLAGIIIFSILKNKLLVLPNGEAVGVIPRAKSEVIKENININEKLSKIGMDRLKVIFFMFIFIIIYVAGNQQIFSSMIIFAENNVNNVIPIINQQVTPQFYFDFKSIIYNTSKSNLY